MEAPTRKIASHHVHPRAPKPDARKRAHLLLDRDGRNGIAAWFLSFWLGGQRAEDRGQGQSAIMGKESPRVAAKWERVDFAGIASVLFDRAVVVGAEIGICNSSAKVVSSEWKGGVARGLAVADEEINDVHTGRHVDKPLLACISRYRPPWLWSLKPPDFLHRTDDPVSAAVFCKGIDNASCRPFSARKPFPALLSRQRHCNAVVR